MLDSVGSAPETERSSKAEPLTETEAEGLLEVVERLVICRGRAIREIEAGKAVLDDLKGPTGKYRAPLVQVGDTLIVGFNREALARFFPMRASGDRNRLRR